MGGNRTVHPKSRFPHSLEDTDRVFAPERFYATFHPTTALGTDTREKVDARSRPVLQLSK